VGVQTCGSADMWECRHVGVQTCGMMEGADEVWGRVEDAGEVWRMWMRVEDADADGVD
jgi:hypothetical protein